MLSTLQETNAMGIKVFVGFQTKGSPCGRQYNELREAFLYTLFLLSLLS